MGFELVALARDVVQIDPGILFEHRHEWPVMWQDCNFTRNSLNIYKLGYAIKQRLF